MDNLSRFQDSANQEILTKSPKFLKITCGILLIAMTSKLGPVFYGKTEAILWKICIPILFFSIIISFYLIFFLEKSKINESINYKRVFKFLYIQFALVLIALPVMYGLGFGCVFSPGCGENPSLAAIPLILMICPIASLVFSFFAVKECK